MNKELYSIYEKINNNSNLRNKFEEILFKEKNERNREIIHKESIEKFCEINNLEIDTSCIDEVDIQELQTLIYG